MEMMEKPENAESIYQTSFDVQSPSDDTTKLRRKLKWKAMVFVSQMLVILLLAILFVFILLLLIQNNDGDRSNYDLNCNCSTASSSTTYVTSQNENEDIQQKVDDILNYVISLTSSSDVHAKIFNETLNQIKILSATSCKEVQEILPQSPSGVYLFTSPDGNGYRHVYCHMEELCGSGGGWTRLAYLNMSDPSEQCPSGLRFYQSGGVRVCGRPFSGSAYVGSGSCASVQFPSNGLDYSQVCGRVLGYQYGSPDALHIRFNAQEETSIDSYYMDGISITRGSPRQHVWTLMAGLGDSYFEDTYNCPCNSGSTVSVPSFVGNDYFCESGNSNQNYAEILYTSDPLWDGQGCGSLEGPCCSAPGLPWFHRDYGSYTTNDYIELRICSEESTINEDTPVHFYELYVK